MMNTESTSKSRPNRNTAMFLLTDQGENSKTENIIPIPAGIPAPPITQ